MSNLFKNSDIQELMQVIADLSTSEEVENFMEDIATIQEVKDLALRLQVAKHLSRGATYSEIESLTGASATTIARVNKALNYGAGGYKAVLKKK